ncbi:MAG: PAS domain S-box protein [Bacteroidales bacterium]|nr:PAS domain S-box protein [Bacteroidales bacterium]
MEKELSHTELLKKINFLEAENKLLSQKFSVLEREYERLKTLFENIQIGVLIEKEDRTITQVNKHFCKLFNIPSSDMILGMNCGDAIIGASQSFVNPENFISDVSILLKNQKPVFNELLELKDGRFFERDYIPVIHKAEFFGNLWLYRDVTRFIQYEKELKASNEKLELFFNQSLIGFFFMMLDKPIEWNDKTDKEKMLDYAFSNQKVTKINQAMLDQYGAKNEDFIGLTPTDFFAHNIKHGRKVWRDFFDKGHYKVETHEKKFNGTDMIIEGDYICLYNEKNRIIGHFGVQQEVTERKLNEQIFQDLYKNAPLPYQSLDVNGNILKVNSKWCDITGYKINEVTGKCFRDFLSSKSQKAFDEKFPILIKTGIQDQTFFELITKNGNTIIAKFEGCVSRDDKNNFLFTNCVFENVTEKIKAENALKASEEKFRTLIENMTDNVFLIDKNFKVVSVNHSAEKLLKEKKENIIGKKISDIFPKYISDEYEQTLKEVFKNRKAIAIDSDLAKGDIKLYINTRLTPILEQDGLVQYIIGVSTDITERRKNELLLIEQEQKLRELNATKDKFFSIIAHDLRSPFGAILGFAEMITKKAQNKDYQKIEYFSSIINQSAKHTFDLLNNLLHWSRIQQGKLEFNPIVIKMNDLVTETLNLLQANFTEKNITIEFETDKEISYKADLFMLQTTVRNLLSNAIKYTPNFGKITVKTTENHNDIEIEITDTGVGIAPQDIEKLFKVETSYSTAGTNNEKGTGLGLILCNEFIKKHNGKIYVESELNKGSIFKIKLPMIKK